VRLRRHTAADGGVTVQRR